MNETSIFIQQAPSFQFLSVCHYITILGVYFYNNDLIKLEERNQSVPVLNTLFDYIDKSGNATQTKYQILKKVLKGSDLYGGGENETLDMKYVDETYHYIISTVLFSHYGNINGYLAKIINRANDVNYSAIKEMVLRHLSERYITKEYCSSGNFSSRLSPLAIDKVYQEHILPIFPEPEEDISIVDVSYIYAMIGLKIVKTIAAEVTNFTFQEYILISREIDLQDLNDETDQMVFKLFQIPALFYYAFNYRETFRKNFHATLTVDFWNEAYKKLFSYINSSMRRIVRDNLENSLYNKLEQQLSKLQSRTHIAATILQLYCKYESIEQVPELYISIYKTLYKWLTILYLPKHCDSDIPDLETVYYEQFPELEKTYNEIERNSIEKVLVDSNLLDIMDLNSTVKLGKLSLPSTMGCHLCSPIAREMNKDIYLLFTIMRENEDSNYYALRQANNTLSLLSSNGNELNFAKTVANDSSLKMDTGLIPTTLKFKHEDYKLFVQRVADIKTKQFITRLKMYYYEETLGEKYLNFFKSLIPFYNCIESATAGRGGEAAFSCTLDVFSLIPFAGLTAKYATKITSSLSTNIGNMFLLTNTLAKTGIITKIPLMTSLNQIAKMAVRTIAKEILTRNLVKDLVVATLRTLDPGFELFYKISNFGFRVFQKLFQNVLSKIKNVPAVEKVLSFLNSFLRNTQDNMKLVADQMGLVPTVLARREGYDIVRYIYPGGSHFFGPSCVSSLGRSAQLRTIEGSSTKIPVLTITNPDNTFYKQYIPETGEILNSKLKMDGNDVLHRIGYLLDTMFIEGRNVNILRNYHVYHNTMDWKKAPTNEKSNDNLNPPTEQENSNHLLNVLQNQDNSREYVIQQNYQHLESLQDQGNIAGHSISYEQNFELPGTSKATVKTEDFNLHFDHSLYSVTLRDLLNSGEKAPRLDSKFVVDTTATGPDALQIIHPNIPQKTKKKFLLPKSERTQDEITIFPDIMKKEEGSVIAQPYIHKKFDARLPRKRIYLPLEESKAKIQNHLQTQGAILENQNKIQDTSLSKKSRTIDSTSNVQWTQVRGRFEMENLDNIPGTSKQKLSELDQNLYKKIIREPTYTKYVEILMMLKNYGIEFIRRDKANKNFLRVALNKIALLQIDSKIPSKKSLKLWCTQIIKEQESIDFLRSLKGRHFFFNDITLLQNKPFGSMEKADMFKFSLSTEIRYHLTFDTSYSLVDLTNFNHMLHDNYVITNDVMFIIQDTFFTANNKILNVQLRNVDTSREYSRYLREHDMTSILQEESEFVSPRMYKIIKAADFMVNNAILCTFKASKEFLSNFILKIMPGTSNSVPTYDMLANDFASMKMLNFYNNYKIKSNTHVHDVLTKQFLDEVIDLSAATSRIHEVYDSVYFHNIEEAFKSYRKIPFAEQRFRFEDYYVLHSYIKNRLLINNDGMRRLEVSINRLALRQCDQEWIAKRIVLYRAEFITKDLSQRLLMSLYPKNIIAFGTFKHFSPSFDEEVVKFLNNGDTSLRVPLLIEVNVKNQAGIVDLKRALNEDYPIHITTSDIEFVLQDIYYENVFGKRVLKMKLEDYENPTEVRMVKIANNLHELFSKDTKFYSKLV